MATYRAWYQKDFRTPARTFVPVQEIVTPDDGPAGLEQAYYFSQGEVWSPNGEAREYIKSLGLSHTSMMVGDCLEEIGTGKVWEVASFGFEEIKSKVGYLLPKRKAFELR